VKEIFTVLYQYSDWLWWLPGLSSG